VTSPCVVVALAVKMPEPAAAGATGASCARMLVSRDPAAAGAASVRPRRAVRNRRYMG
jgi:hypothetical protein